MIIEVEQDSDTIDCVETDPAKRSAIADSWRAFMRSYLARVFDVPESSVTVQIGPGMISNVWTWPRDGAPDGPTEEQISEHIETHGFDAWLRSL